MCVARLLLPLFCSPSLLYVAQVFTDRLDAINEPNPAEKAVRVCDVCVSVLCFCYSPCSAPAHEQRKTNMHATAQMLTARADIVSEVVTSLTQTAVRGVVRGLINNVLLSTRAAAQRNVHPLLLLVDDVVAATLPALLLEAARQLVNDLVAEFLVGRHFDGMLLAR